MPPPVLCVSGVCKNPPNVGKLGQAPNKYCYRVDCQEIGIDRGHIRKQGGGGSSKRVRPGSAAGATSSAPMPEQMSREEPPSFGVAELYKIHALYGFRYGCWRCAFLSLTARTHHPPFPLPTLAGPSTQRR